MSETTQCWRPPEFVIPEGKTARLVQPWDAIVPDTFWYHEREGSVWRVAEMLAHADGDASLVMEHLGGGAKGTQQFRSMTQKCVHEGAYTQTDEAGARELARSAPWWRKAWRSVCRWFGA